MQILTAGDTDLDGFRGVRERQYLMASSFFQRLPEPVLEGPGNLLYLADAYFIPGGSTGRHHHAGIDILTLLVRGRLEHLGSLGDRSLLLPGEIMLQQAGETGFSHDEVNPETSSSRIIQVWMKPTRPGVEARYCHYPAPALNSPQQVYPPPGEHSDYRCLHLWMAAGQRYSEAGLCAVFVVSGEIVVTEGEAQARLTTGSLALVNHPQLTWQADSRVLLFTPRRT